MSIKFFGQFLLERRVLSAEQLLEALGFQESRNLKFGAYAQSKGYLTPAQVDTLNEEQKRTDLRIGELSVKLKMLTSQQVDEILTMQKNDHLQIGKVLVMKGFLTEARVNQELEAFKADQSIYKPGVINVPEGIKRPESIMDIVDITVKMLIRVALVEAKSDEGQIIKVDPTRAYGAVRITMSGGANCDYVLLADEGAACALASCVVGEDVSHDSMEIIVDGFKEFVNIVCGNILARMAQRGKSVEISIPHVLEHKGARGYGIIGTGTAVCYTIATTAGILRLVLVEP